MYLFVESSNPLTSTRENLGKSQQALESHYRLEDFCSDNCSYSTKSQLIPNSRKLLLHAKLTQKLPVAELVSVSFVSLI